MQSVIKRCALFAVVMTFIANISVLTVSATTLDDLTGNSAASEQVPQNNGYTEGYGSESITDYLRGYTPVTAENMASAATAASPLVNVIGTISGFIVMVTSAAIFMVTAADLAYIGLPFTRAWLNPMYAAGGAQAGGMPMGGMGMGGMGMRGGVGMGMGGMGGMGGGAQAPVESGLRRRWVSDEAVYCVNTYCQPQQQAQGGMPMGGGMGMGMGGMGAMGGMGMGGQQQQPMPMKSVIFEYLKKRVFFLIVFAVATTVLMSSVFTDCGINLGLLTIKIFAKFSGQVSQVQM